jgi:L-ribulose-5-phosphate 3-epimerase
MSSIKIGIRLDCLGLPLRDAIPAAARLGVQGVQLQSTNELAPDELSQTGRRHLLHSLQTQRLEAVALGSTQRRGFDSMDRLEERITFVGKVVRMAADLRLPFIVVPIGAIPPQNDTPHAAAFYDAVRRVCDVADRVGVRIAVETGPSSLPELATFIKGLDRHPLAVNFDPANLMARGFDPFDGLSTLADRVVGLHVKDLIRTSTTVSGFQETPLGEGELDFDRLHRELAALDYRGYWTLERDAPGGGGEREFANSVAVLSRL